jgi:hypothetical protein
MSIKRSGFALSGRPQLGFGIAIVCTCAGCACPIGVDSGVYLPASDSNAAVRPPPSALVNYDVTPGPYVDLSAPDEALLQPASVDAEFLKKAEPPACEIAGVTEPASGEPGANADQNLVTIARLQIERDCYMNAERAVRRRLERLQMWSIKHTSNDSEHMKKAEPPTCKIEGATKPPPGTPWPGANADPNLLKIGRLQLESECYKTAERAVRERLERLQSLFVDDL